MENKGNPGVTTSDESLVLLARAGDRSAFADLWQRHAASGLRVARQFTSSIDADDLVSEAYARIYQRVLAGGGPEGAFRPYLYTTIRNLASRWGKTRHDVNVDDIGEFEDPAAGSDPVSVALDRTLTVRAFRSLPDRWQSVLWYTEVEGMDPHEVAPLLGISANSVAALSYRAREGLRTAWLQAHVSDAIRSGDCQWAITRLGDYARNGLTTRERVRVSDHLATCTKCLIISEEVDEVGSRLALVMLPLLLGGVAGGTLLASLSAPSSAMAASALVSATMPPAFGVLGSVGAVTVPTVVAGLSIPALSAPALVTLAIALAISGGMALGVPNQPANASASSAVASPVGDVTRTSLSGTGVTPGSVPVSRPTVTPVGTSPTSRDVADAADQASGHLPSPGGTPSTDTLVAQPPALTAPGALTPGGTLPPLALPPLSLPPLSVPPLSLPPLSLPGISLPGVNVPGINLPVITVPVIAASAIPAPVVSVPATPVPAISVPSVFVPGISLPVTAQGSVLLRWPH